MENKQSTVKYLKSYGHVDRTVACRASCSIPADSNLVSLLGYHNLSAFSSKTALGQHTHVKKVPFVVRYRAQKVVLGK